MIIPRPTYINEPDPESVAGRSPSMRWVQWYQSAPSWKCGKCEAVMFGRMMYCVYCKQRLSTHTPRPSSYVDTSGPAPPQ